MPHMHARMPCMSCGRWGWRGQGMGLSECHPFRGRGLGVLCLLPFQQNGCMCAYKVFSWVALNVASGKRVVMMQMGREGRAATQSCAMATCTPVADWSLNSIQSGGWGGEGGAALYLVYFGPSPIRWGGMGWQLPELHWILLEGTHTPPNNFPNTRHSPLITPLS